MRCLNSYVMKDFIVKHKQAIFVAVALAALASYVFPWQSLQAQVPNFNLFGSSSTGDSNSPFNFLSHAGSGQTLNQQLNPLTGSTNSFGPYALQGALR